MSKIKAWDIRSSRTLNIEIDTHLERFAFFQNKMTALANINWWHKLKIYCRQLLLASHSSGLYYKHITIVNDNSRVISKWNKSSEVSDAPMCGVMFMIVIDTSS